MRFGVGLMSTNETYNKNILKATTLNHVDRLTSDNVEEIRKKLFPGIGMSRFGGILPNLLEKEEGDKKLLPLPAWLEKKRNKKINDNNKITTSLESNVKRMIKNDLLVRYGSTAGSNGRKRKKNKKKQTSAVMDEPEVKRTRDCIEERVGEENEQVPEESIKVDEEKMTGNDGTCMVNMTFYDTNTDNIDTSSYFIPSNKKHETLIVLTCINKNCLGVLMYCTFVGLIRVATDDEEIMRSVLIEMASDMKKLNRGTHSDNHKKYKVDVAWFTHEGHFEYIKALTNAGMKACGSHERFFSILRNVTEQITPAKHLDTRVFMVNMAHISYASDGYVKDPCMLYHHDVFVNLKELIKNHKLATTVRKTKELTACEFMWIFLVKYLFTPCELPTVINRMNYYRDELQNLDGIKTGQTPSALSTGYTHSTGFDLGNFNAAVHGQEINRMSLDNVSRMCEIYDRVHEVSERCMHNMTTGASINFILSQKRAELSFVPLLCDLKIVTLQTKAAEVAPPNFRSTEQMEEWVRHYKGSIDEMLSVNSIVDYATGDARAVILEDVLTKDYGSVGHSYYGDEVRYKVDPNSGASVSMLSIMQHNSEITRREYLVDQGKKQRVMSSLARVCAGSSLPIWSKQKNDPTSGKKIVGYYCANLVTPEEYESCPKAQRGQYKTLEDLWRDALRGGYTSECVNSLLFINTPIFDIDMKFGRNGVIPSKERVKKTAKSLVECCKSLFDTIPGMDCQYYVLVSRTKNEYDPVKKMGFRVNCMTNMSFTNRAIVEMHNILRLRAMKFEGILTDPTCRSRSDMMDLFDGHIYGQNCGGRDTVHPIRSYNQRKPDGSGRLECVYRTDGLDGGDLIPLEGLLVHYPRKDRKKTTTLVERFEGIRDIDCFNVLRNYSTRTIRKHCEKTGGNGVGNIMRCLNKLHYVFDVHGDDGEERERERFVSGLQQKWTSSVRQKFANEVIQKIARPGNKALVEMRVNELKVKIDEKDRLVLGSNDKYYSAFCPLEYHSTKPLNDENGNSVLITLNAGRGSSNLMMFVNCFPCKRENSVHMHTSFLLDDNFYLNYVNASFGAMIRSIERSNTICYIAVDKDRITFPESSGEELSERGADIGTHPMDKYVFRRISQAYKTTIEIGGAAKNIGSILMAKAQTNEHMKQLYCCLSQQGICIFRMEETGQRTIGVVTSVSSGAQFDHIINAENMDCMIHAINNHISGTKNILNLEDERTLYSTYFWGDGAKE